jgi:hypothetical protein
MAKRKNNKLKVKIAKNNVLYYYLKGKRLKSAEGQKIQEQQFQKRSDAAKKAAANTYKYRGRPIPRIYAVLIQKIYPSVNFLKTMDLSEWLDPATGNPLFDRYSKIQKTIDNASKQDLEIFKLLTEMGYFDGSDKRTALIDICEIVKQKEYDKFKFILINYDGKEIRGRMKVCEAIRKFEEYVTSEIAKSLGMNVIKTYFDYSPNYDFKNKIFELDLSDTNKKLSIADIVSESKGQLVIPEKYKDKKDKEGKKYIFVEPKSSIGKNKFKKVLITYSLS